MAGTYAAAEGADGGMQEISRLRAQVASLGNEREMRVKLEKLLEVQTVQVDLQKELRVKTESLLQVEQQTTSKLRLTIEGMHMMPGPEMETKQKIEQRLADAHQHIKKMEQQMAESSAPETSDRMESQLLVQVEEKERLIMRLTKQLESQGLSDVSAPSGEPVRLQLLLQSRDKQVDELTQNMRKVQNDTAEAQSEADVLKHQVRVMRKEVSEKSQEMERQLNTERNLRAEVFSLQAKLEQLGGQHQEESRRASEYAQTAARAEEMERRAEQLGAQLAEEQTTSNAQRNQVLAEAEYRVQAKEQVVKHQTATILSLNTEMREKQAEIDKLVRSSVGGSSPTPKADVVRERGGLLPPIVPASPRGGGDDMQAHRSIESLNRQLKTKDGKIAKQADRIGTLTEMLEKRDQQLDELATARRDRETMSHRLKDLEEAQKAQPRATSHAEAERRLIEQEARMRGVDRKTQGLELELQQERGDKETMQRELLALRGHVTEGVASSGGVQGENDRLSQELAEVRRILEGRTEELRRVRESRPLPTGTQQDAPRSQDASRPATLGALQRRLQKFEELDKDLGRDVSVWIQEKDVKIDSLSSTITLLRNSVEELRHRGGGEAGGTARDASGYAGEARGPNAGAPAFATAPAETTATAPASASPGRPPPVGGPVRPVPVAQNRGFGEQGPVASDYDTQDIRQELLMHRQESIKFDQKLNDKQQLVMKLIEEANLCNAEVASLQQTVQQSYKQARKREKEFDKLVEEKEKFEKVAQEAQRKLGEKEGRLAKMLTEHQQDTGGNAAVDEIDRGVSWKLKVMPPREHEIRHSMTLALNRSRMEDPSREIDLAVLEQRLAHHFAISVQRIRIIEGAPYAGVGTQGGEDVALADAIRARSPGGVESYPADADGLDDSQDAVAGVDGQQTGAPNMTVLVSINDTETDKDGQTLHSTVSALDVLDQIRNDFLRGRSIPAIDEVEIDAVFLHHGDMLLPLEWPANQARCLLREGRVLADKHAVVTVHEVRDPYILRIVAYDTEQGREFVLFLNKRDVTLLLDAHDGAAPGMDATQLTASYSHLAGELARDFQSNISVVESHLLEVIVDSLSFSEFQQQQILVASEMRTPSTTPTQMQMVAYEEKGQGGDLTRDLTLGMGDLSSTIQSTAQAPSMSTGKMVVAPMLLEDLTLAPLAVLPQAGITRGLIQPKKETRRLFEDVIGFEGRLCIFSVVHTTMSDFSQDVLLASIYYPRTCARVEACLHQPMLSDRMRIVAEAGQLDHQGPLTVAIVVEEMIYPPSFLIRLTSITLGDVTALSPTEEAKPHSHVIRVAKDGSSALHLPDISFAISPSTLRDKLLRCIGISSPVQGPRETLIMMQPASNAKGDIVKRAVTGHVRAPFGLKVQLISKKHKEMSESDQLTTDMPPECRARLRVKFGKGRLLVRHGRMLRVQGKSEAESIRVVVTIYERPQPYQHFLMSAYEPQTSREWEMIADSIDIFRLFTDNKKDGQGSAAQALDLTNPATQEKLAEILVNCVELAEQNHELTLVISPDAIRTFTEQRRATAAIADTDSSVPDGTPDLTASTAGEPFEVKTAVSRVTHRGAEDDGAPIEQRSGDRLFTAQRSFAFPHIEPPVAEAFKIQIYDSPLISTLHSYVVVASPVHGNVLGSAGLPVAIAAVGASITAPEHMLPHQRTYTLQVNDKILSDFVTDFTLLEPTMQEQLLHAIFQGLFIQKDKETGKLKMALRKPVSATMLAQAKENPQLLAELQDQGHVIPGMMPDSSNCREIGGQFPLVRLGVSSKTSSKLLAGPSLRGLSQNQSGKVFARDWKKVFCMAQSFGQATVMITVSKRRNTYKLAVYEPESSSLYEMLMETSASSTPLNVLVERIDLAGKLDLVLCMFEVAFPHQLSINIVHVPSAQEFNLKIGDDMVYTMIENSRRDAFMIYLDQLLHWGVCGFDASPGNEEEMLADVYVETFAGNQIFDRTQIEDLLKTSRDATLQSGELKAPVALAPQAPKKIQVPVIRLHLDHLNAGGGKQAPPVSSLAMSLLYHAEHSFVTVGCPTQTLMMRIHKRANNNDIAITLRVKTADLVLSLPDLPASWASGPTACAANGRPFETPALSASEGAGNSTSEVTFWHVDKCSKAPSGAYGELIEVPGIDKPLLLLITDEDSPRAIRVCVTLATLPFTVLFQAVFLENAETSAKVEASRSGNRIQLQKTFHKYFGSKHAPTSNVLSKMSKTAAAQRDMDLKKQLDNISATEDKPTEHLGLEHGHGLGEPTGKAPKGDTDSGRHAVNVSIVNMCTRQKMGRMMVFTIFRDMIAQNMYLRVVMHDPVTKKEQHLTLLHYTTQRLLNLLRINRDMIEDTYINMTDNDHRERSKLRQELGKLIVDHLFLMRVGDSGNAGEVVDDEEMPEGEEVEYELQMRDIMASATSSDLSMNQKTLASAHELYPEESKHLQSIGADTPTAPLSMHPAQAGQQSGPLVVNAPVAKTLIDMTEDDLLHKAEKVVNGRRMLVAFYNKTSSYDTVNYSHNIRIVVACVQSLAVLAVQDFHEDTLEALCARRGKRHLMSATAEQELVRELCDLLALEHQGSKITGISFAGLDE